MFQSGSKIKLVCDNCGWSKTSTHGDVIIAGQFDWEKRKVVDEKCPKCNIGSLLLNDNIYDEYQAPE